MSKHVAAYVPEKQYERWQEEANEKGMSMSEWTKSMVEAGRKKFDRDLQPDRTRDELRQQRNDLRDELGRARERVQELEEKVHTSERQEIIKYVSNNPGAEYQDIVQHIVNTANSRVTKLLDELEADQLEIDEQGRMYVR